MVQGVNVEYNDYVEIEWVDTTTDEEGFNIYRSTADNPVFPDDYDQIGSADDNTETYADIPYEPGVYTYTVTSFTDSGESMHAAPDSVAVTETETRELAAGLPVYYPNSPESGNYKLLKAIGERVHYQKDVLSYIDSITNVQEAETERELEELGKLIDTNPREDESLEHYRARLMVRFSLTTGTGTINDLIETVAGIFAIAPEQVNYNEPAGGEHGALNVGVPTQAVDRIGLGESDLVELLDDLIAAGYRLEAQVIGTFTYITVTMYQNDEHDATKGYDGLGTDDTPKDNGGTYAGLIS